MKRDYSFLDKLERGMYYSKKAYDKKHIPSYDEVINFLPSPYMSSHPQWRECYDYAVKVLYRNIHEPKEGSGFVSAFVDAAFNADIFLWDTSFMTMFCSLFHPYIPGICSLDNFYAKQFDDGEIPREIVRDTGKDMLLWVNAYNKPLYSYFHKNYKYRGLWECGSLDYVDFYKPDLGHVPERNPYLTLDNLNHPILFFAEWVSYRQTGDIKRLSDVFEPLYQYYRALHYHIRHTSALYVTDWASMDNSTRNKDLFLAVDTSSEMVFFAHTLLLIIDELEAHGFDIKDKNERRKTLLFESSETKDAINRYMWDERTGFYYDLDRNMNRIPIKTAAAFWTIISGVADETQLKRLSLWLDDTASFKRLHRVPVLAADEESYDPNGNYWRGSVWAPINAMVVLGLTERGYREQAEAIALNDLDAVTNVFKSTGTIWENYPADNLTKGYSDHPDMVGWSGMAPILFFIRYGVGLESGNDGLVWYLKKEELEKGSIGCTNYWWKEKTASFDASVVDGKVVITVRSAYDFDFLLNLDGEMKRISVNGNKRVEI